MSNLIQRSSNFVKNINSISKSNNLLFTLIFFSFIGSIFEAIGLFSLLPVITALTNYDLLTNFVLNYLNINLSEYSQKIVTYFFCLFSIFLFSIKFIITVSINYFLNSKSYNIQRDTRQNLLNSIMNLNFENFANLDQAEIINTILNTTHEYVELTLRPFIRFLSELLLVILLFSFLIYTFLFESIVIFFIFSLFLTMYFLFIKNKIKFYGELSDKSYKKYIEYLNYNIKGKDEISILGFKNKFIKYANNYLNNFTESKKKSVFFEILPRHILEFIIFIIINILVILNLSVNQNTFLLLDLSIMGLVSLRLLPSINIIVISLVQIRFSNYHFNRLIKLLEKYTAQEKFTEKSIINEDAINLIELKNISFFYQRGNMVLENINLQIKKNSTIGIFGESGAGKTTLIKIILGILKPHSGEILINNKVERIDSFQKNFFYLKQENFLVNDTVMNNITLFDNDRFNNEYKKIQQVLLKLNLIDYPEDFDNFLNLELGDNGIKLSGGQRQRLIIARAIYFNKNFIILDEPSSSLDYKNSLNLISLFESLKNYSSLIIVSHDHKLINSCDYKYKLKNKKIIKI